MTDETTGGSRLFSGEQTAESQEVEASYDDDGVSFSADDDGIGYGTETEAETETKTTAAKEEDSESEVSEDAEEDIEDEDRVDEVDDEAESESDEESVEEEEDGTDVDIPDGVDEFLIPLYKANPEKAAIVHKIYEQQKEWAALGHTEESLNEAATNYATLRQDFNKVSGEATETREAMTAALAFRRRGDIDSMLSVLGKDLGVEVERYMAAKIEARENHTLNEFLSQFSGSRDQVAATLENQRLRQELDTRDTQSRNQQQIYWQNRLDSDPIMAKINEVTDDPLFALQLFKGIHDGLEASQRNLETIFGETRQKAANYLKRFGGTIEKGRAKAREESTRRPVKKRPASLKPPSRTTKQKGSAVRKRHVETLDSLMAEAEKYGHL